MWKSQKPLRILPEQQFGFLDKAVCVVEVTVEQGWRQGLFKSDTVLPASGKQHVYLLQPSCVICCIIILEFYCLWYTWVSHEYFQVFAWSQVFYYKPIPEVLSYRPVPICSIHFPKRKTGVIRPGFVFAILPVCWTAVCHGWTDCESHSENRTNPDTVLFPCHDTIQIVEVIEMANFRKQLWMVLVGQRTSD